uniref:Sodium/hydrogen exchanger n=1 Tax=Hucho hucho TaxID=62062 RepID=A0A4W5PMU4_9TELE
MAALWHSTFFLVMVLLAISRPSLASQGTVNGTENLITTLPIVTWNWQEIKFPYLVALWILVSWLCKLVFQLNPSLTSVIPESGLLICIGWVLGGIIYWADKVQTFKLQPFIFFFYLLPQIVLDAGYSMPNKLFFSNFGSILVYAVIGTCWNAATLGLALWGCCLGGAIGDIDIGLLQLLLFGSLIAAVDPVAVIAVFEEVHVNEVLYILVFGESLLNDGVTVVLFNVFNAFVSLGGAQINAVEIIKGIISFFVVALGGSLVGVIFALLISLLTRCTKNIQIIEPGFIFILGYLSYLTAEMLSLSAILSCTFCGVCCQKYINANMDKRSVSTLRYVMKVFANGSETIIFVFLGITAIDPSIWVWNTAFILLTLLFIFVFRFIGVFFLTWILNQYRLVPLEFIDQLMMGYGGLRGAVAYGLVVLLDENKYKEKNLMISTTLLVVYFTVMLQGITMKPLVTWLKVKRAAVTERTLAEIIQNRTFDHILVAIEDISGQIGHNYMRDKWNNFEERWLYWLLMTPSARKSCDHIFNIFHKLNLKDAMSYVKEGERRGSLAFVRNETKADVDFNKKFSGNFSAMMPYIMAENMGSDHVPVSSILWDSVHSVCLDMHEKDLKMRESEDFNAHHLLEQHLYRGKKQHRHRYSREYLEVNKDKNEVQEIFQRTMRSRLESFKSAKMGVNPPKKISYHLKKDQPQKMPNGKSTDNRKSHAYGKEDLEFSEGDSASGCEAAGGSFPMRAHRGAGIVNPAFNAEMDPMPAMQQILPWLAEAEVDSSAVVPSQRAQLTLPCTPSNLHRLAPLHLTTHSFLLADSPATQDTSEPPPPPVV